MKHLAICKTSLLAAFAIFSACSTAPKAPDVTGEVKKSLDQPAFKDVSVSQDRDKGVVTLSGHVASDADKTNAENLAKTIIGNQVLADEIAIYPPGNESAAKTIDSDVDKGIEKNLDAALIQHRLNKGVKYSVNNSVVTLQGDVNSQQRRAEAERVASTVPNVSQVVNELQVKNQKATSHTD